MTSNDLTHTELRLGSTYVLNCSREGHVLNVPPFYPKDVTTKCLMPYGFHTNWTHGIWLKVIFVVRKRHIKGSDIFPLLIHHRSLQHWYLFRLYLLSKGFGKTTYLLLTGPTLLQALIKRPGTKWPQQEIVCLSIIGVAKISNVLYVVSSLLSM